MQRLLAFYKGVRPADRPFFVAPGEPTVPLTYQMAMRHIRRLYEKASSSEEAKLYGLHSLRVTGYTLAKRGAGEALAVAQGGWRSDAHMRYERFSAEQVQALPAVMLATRADTSEALVRTPVVAQPRAAESEPAVVPPQVPARATPARAAGSQQIAASPAPLTQANCVGRRVLCPADMWPSWACKEHGGTGWEARVDKVKGDGTVLVTFVTQGPKSRKWRPMWLQLAHLRPV